MRSRRGRLGFTLTEMLVAAALGTVVGTIVVKAYQGMAKAQGVAQGSADLRDMGTNSTETIYRELKHIKRIFNRPGLGGNLTASWLGRVPVRGLYATGSEPIVEPGPDRGASSPVDELLLPAINPEANLVTGDPANPLLTDLSPEQVGNALFFLTLESRVSVKPFGSEPAPAAAFIDEVYGDGKEVTLGAYRAHLYFMAKKPVGTGPTLRPGSPYTYTLMHWQSDPYVDASEVDYLADAVLGAWPGAGKAPKPPKGTKKPPKGAGRPATEADAARNYMNALMVDLDDRFKVAGLMNPEAEDGSVAPAAGLGHAIFRSSFSTFSKGPNKAINLVANSSGGMRTGDFRTALRGMARSGHGAIDLAFNTDAGGGFPAVQAGTLRVPAFGSPTDGVPFGFETVVVGPPASRQVLFRISLSGRTLGARGNYAQSFQQVVAIAEE